MDDLELIEEPHVAIPYTSADDVHLLDWDCPEKLKFLIEGALFATSERITAKSIQMLFPDEARPNMIEIKAALSAIQHDYAQRAVELHSSDLGYRFQVKQAATPLVKTMLTEKPPKYSRASLETLALIAYRQPITRGEIEEIRGVSVSSQIMKTMEEREWIRVVGHKELPGRPALWATTPGFLDYFGLSSLEDLPPLAEIQGLDKEENDNHNAINSQNSEILEVAEPREPLAQLKALAAQSRQELSQERSDDCEAQISGPLTEEADQLDLKALHPTAPEDVQSNQESSGQKEEPLHEVLNRLRNAGKNDAD